ncbi:MAG: NADH-quinone oxidoreductase subunit L [Acidimicrobiia bacterium]
MSARHLLEWAWMIPALPLLGAAVLLLFGKRIGEPIAGYLATAMIGLAFVWSVATVLALHSLGPEERRQLSQGFTWIAAGGLHVDLRFYVDQLSSTMILFVTGIGALIHLYAIGYMHGDARFSRFFAYMNLFAASMLVLVLGSSYLVTFLGWEGVGLCSYLLISFWFERNSAAVAGKKAFVTNRVGDFGFMLAMFLIFAKVGSLDFAGKQSVFGHLGAYGGKYSATMTAIGLLLFLGAIGKSAQLPLHVWLPDAMEGPTPVSALIHAATMVTAGVYLMCRSNFFVTNSHAATTIGWVGALTALFAATVALVNNDIKRVLAYSTISQLGYMFLAVGVGAYSAAVFHMVTHAFFKALLFLGAGSEMHGLHEEQDMRYMGRLRRYMPITAGTFIVGWLAIAGVFPFAGFWSKDEILASAWFDHSYGLWFVGLVAALLTAFYMTRQVYLVFMGDSRWRDPAAAPTAVPVVAGGADEHAEPGGAHAGADAHGARGPLPHESPWQMTVPLLVLAGLAILGGLLSLPFAENGIDFLAKWLEPVVGTGPEPTSFGAAFVLSCVALLVALGGIAIGISMYRRGIADPESDPLPGRLGPLAGLFGRAWYVDDGVSAFVGGPGRTAFSWISRVLDQGVIDGAVNGVAAVFRSLGGGLRRLQTGLVRNYALGILVGALLLLGYFGLRAL